MKYRFLVADYDGFTHSAEKEFSSDDDALDHVKVYLSDIHFVKSVDLYRMMSDDSCGPMQWIGYYDLDFVMTPNGMREEIKG